MVKTILLPILFVLSTAAWAQSEYPDWFYGPLPDGWAVVFAPSEGEAVDRAAAVLTTYRQFLAHGQFQSLYDSAIDSRTWQNSDYNFDYSAQRAAALRGSLQARSSYVIDVFHQMRVWLVGPKGKDFTGSTAVSPWAGRPRPDWADSWAGLDTKAGRRYGVGRFSLQGAPADAWVTAETMAIFNLLVAKQLRLAQVNVNETAGGTERSVQMRSIVLNFQVADLRVDGRWVDTDDGDALVLVSAPENKVVVGR